MRIKNNLILLTAAPAIASTFTGISSLTRRSTLFTPQKERADAVKEAFRFAWSGYYDHAFPNDELHPVSNGFGNSRCADPPFHADDRCLMTLEMDGARALSTL